VPVGVTANYHFILSVRQLDPFVGAGLSDRFASPSNGAGSGQADRVSFLGRAGARWGAGSLLSLYAEADTGPPWLNGGVMLTFR
jgi:outer membrane protein W